MVEIPEGDAGSVVKPLASRAVVPSSITSCRTCIVRKSAPSWGASKSSKISFKECLNQTGEVPHGGAHELIYEPFPHWGLHCCWVRSALSRLMWMKRAKQTLTEALDCEWSGSSTDHLLGLFLASGLPCQMKHEIRMLWEASARPIKPDLASSKVAACVYTVAMQWTPLYLPGEVDTVRNTESTEVHYLHE